MDTMQATIVNNFLINQIDKSGIKSLFAIKVWLLFNDLGTLVGDLVESVQVLEAFTYHKDMFNFGIIAGKTSKILMQFYMAGWI